MTKVSDSYPENTGNDNTNDELKASLISKYQATTAAGPAAKSTFHTEVVSLPSKGVLYPKDSILSTGQLNMKYMTAKEEDILTSQNLIKTGVVIDRLLQSLVVDNVDLGDLLIGDKNAVLIAARILAYGPAYEAEITCPSCGSKTNQVIDISKFDEKSLEDGTYTPNTNEFYFDLPASKQRIGFRFLTSADEKIIEEELKGLKKLSKITGIDPDMTTRLRHIVTSVDGNSDPLVIRNFVDTMLSRDSLAFRKHISSIMPDIDMTFNYECSNCGHNEPNLGMPMTVSFFWPRA